MYPDEIQTYTTAKQFEDHKKMLQEMEKYFRQAHRRDYGILKDIHDEQLLLRRLQRKWAHNQRRKSPVGR
ncbi:hypothetical protein [Enterococcus gilvus]|uniref:hypothetical protein n=1 Tax=Enterococcus gilvus TaxID=160453 RepID=UPI003ED8908F